VRNNDVVTRDGDPPALWSVARGGTAHWARVLRPAPPTSPFPALPSAPSAVTLVAVMNLPPGLHRHPRIRNVLVVGPNGNVGRALIPELLRLGYEVRALQYRTPVAPQPGLEVVPGHTLDPESLQRAVQGVDAICHLVRATGPSTPGDSTPCEKWFNLAVRGAVNLFEAAKEVPLVRFVAGSADNVFGHTTMAHTGPITEQHPKRFADDYYGLFKVIEEELCRQYHLGFGVPVTITRFGLIWNTELAGAGIYCLDRPNRKIRQRLDRDGQPLLRQDVHIDDVVQGILLALEQDAAVGEDFNIVAANPYRSDELAAVLTTKWPWPVEPVPTDWYSWTTDCAKAREVLGYEPRVDCLDWLRAELPRLP